MSKKKGLSVGLIFSISVVAVLGLTGLLALGVLAFASTEDWTRVRGTPVPSASTAAPSTLRPTPTLTPVPTPTATPVPTLEPTPTPVPDARIRIRVVGDIMCHDRQIRASEQEDGSYDMTDWFEVIAPSLEQADLVIGNLETSFAGPEEEYSGFPHFNTPDALADALKGAGFDVLTTANNHSNDFRAAGIARTLEVLDAAGLAHTGSYASQEDFEQQLIVEVKGIRVGVLAYSATFNSTPKEDYHVRALSQELVERDVQAMRDQGADYVLCMVHWGEEYEERADSTQREQATMLAECGVDAIFGSHPHVIQTAEMLTVDDGQGGQKHVPVAYSMGNFISNQQNRPCDMGIIFEIELLRRGDTGETSLEGAGFVPTVVYRGDDGDRDTYSVLPCGVYMEKEDHPKRHRCETVWEHEVELMGEGFEPMVQ